jgi:hypothetical protein
MVGVAQCRRSSGALTRRATPLLDSDRVKSGAPRDPQSVDAIRSSGS